MLHSFWVTSLSPVFIEFLSARLYTKKFCISGIRRVPASLPLKRGLILDEVRASWSSWARIPGKGLPGTPYVTNAVKLFSEFFESIKSGETLSTICTNKLQMTFVLTGSRTSISDLYCDINLDQWHMLTLKNKTIRLASSLKICFLLRIICFLDNLNVNIYWRSFK